MPGFAALLDDVWSPVLLREVKSALRGRGFLVGFMVSLALTLVVTLVWAVEIGGRSETGGQALAAILGLCLMFPMLLLVPFSAYQSVSAERDGDTLELLQLTPLSSFSVALGKLAAVMVQAVLYLSAFTPFLVLAFLARGVALEAVVVQLALLSSSCLMLSAWGLALGGLGRRRSARALLLLLLVVIGGVQARMPLLILVGGPGTLGAAGTGAWAIFGLSMLVFQLLPAAFGLAVAAVRLAHPNANSSTPLRVLTSAALVVAFLAVTWLAYETRMDSEGYAAAVAGIGLALGVPCLFFVTEPDPLPRPVARRLRAGLRLPSVWLPGGSRGALFLVLHLVGLLAAGGAVQLLRHRDLDGFGGPIAAALLVTGYLLLPSTLLLRWVEARPRRRTTVRWLIPGLFFGGIVLAPVVEFLLGGRGGGFDHALNPLWVVIELVDGRDQELMAWALLVGGVGVAFAAMRVVQGVGEVALLRSSGVPAPLAVDRAQPQQHSGQQQAEQDVHGPG